MTKKFVALKAESAAECLAPVQTLYLSVKEEMQVLSDNFKHLFKSYGEPIYYLPNRVHPVIDLTKGRTYVSVNPLPNGETIRVPIASIADIKGSVWTEYDTLVVSREDVELLTNRPWYPKHQLDFIFDYVKIRLKSQIPAFKDIDWFQQLKERYFSPYLPFTDGRPMSEEMLLEETDLRIKIQCILDPLMHQIKFLMGSPNKWMMYDVEQSFFDLTIAQLGDWRAYQWSLYVKEGTDGTHHCHFATD